MKSDVKKKLRILMAERGLNQRGLAQVTGLTEAIISMTVNGKYIPSADQQGRIAQALKTKSTEIFG